MSIEKVIYKEESYKIIGACFEVYNKLGNGFLENVYQEALAIEFEMRNIPFNEQKEIRIKYKDIELKQYYIADFTCYDKIIIEIKAVSNICNEHRGQIINYLNAINYELGLLINFGNSEKLEYERFFKSK